MKVNTTPAVTKTTVVEIEPKKFTLELTFEELECLVDDVNHGHGLAYYTREGKMSDSIWKELHSLVQRNK